MSKIPVALELYSVRDVLAEDLRGTQDYLVGSFPSTMQTVSGLSKRLETLVFSELPKNYYERVAK